MGGSTDTQCCCKAEPGTVSSQPACCNDSLFLLRQAFVCQVHRETAMMLTSAVKASSLHLFSSREQAHEQLVLGCILGFDTWVERGQHGGARQAQHRRELPIVCLDACRSTADSLRYPLADWIWTVQRRVI